MCVVSGRGLSTSRRADLLSEKTVSRRQCYCFAVCWSACDWWGRSWHQPKGCKCCSSSTVRPPFRLKLLRRGVNAVGIYGPCLTVAVEMQRKRFDGRSLLQSLEIMLGHDPAPMPSCLYTALLLRRDGCSASAMLFDASEQLNSITAESIEYVWTAVLLAAPSTCRRRRISDRPEDKLKHTPPLNPSTSARGPSTE